MRRASSTPSCAGWRGSATRSSPRTIPGRTRPTGCAQRWSAHYGPETAAAIAAAHRHSRRRRPHRPGAIRRLGRAPRRPPAADRQRPPRRARRGPASCPATRRAPGGCRTPPRPCRRGSSPSSRASGRRPLRGARRQDRPARRRRSARCSPSTVRPGACERVAENMAPAAASRSRPASPTRRASRPALRRRPPRRALLGDRHDPPPSRRRLDQGRGGHPQARRPPGPPPRQGGGADRSPAAGSSTAPARSSRRRARTRPRPFSAGIRTSRPRPVAPEEVGGLAERVTPPGDLRTLPCHLRLGDARARRARRLLRGPLCPQRATDPLSRFHQSLTIRPEVGS